jgi:hypothetical protein
MSATAHDRTETMSAFVDKYLSEDDKSIILRKSGTSRAIGDGNKFLLHSIATKVRKFIDDGHYVKFMAYGLDYMMLQLPSTFTAASSEFDNIDDLVDFASAYFFEWYQEGSLDDETIDKAYVWMLTTPYVVLSMTERARQEMHKAVDYLWMSPVMPDKSLYVHCYDTGQREIVKSMRHWIDNAPITYSGCGYENIIRPQEVDA